MARGGSAAAENIKDGRLPFLGRAADIARHLDGDVVAARPPARAYRLAKFVRRNKAWVAAGLAVAATLLAGSVGTGVGFVRARQAQAKAERDAARADATSRFMREMFISARPDKVGRGRDVRVADVLDRAADTIAESLARRPEAEIDVRHMLGDTYEALGLYPAAEQNLRRAYALARSTQGPEAEQTLAIAERLAQVLNFRNETHAEGFDLARTAFETSRKVLGEQHRTTRSIGNQLAWSLFRDGNLAEAERLYRRLLAGERAAADGDAQRTGALLNNLSRVLGSLGRLRDAEALTREALAMSSDETDGINHGKKLFQLAGLLADQGRLADARAVYEGNLGRQMERLGEDHVDTWDTRDALAQLYTRTGDFGKALAIRQRMLDRALAPAKGDSFDLANLMFDVGHLLARVGGRDGEARMLLERSLGMTRRLREDSAREGWRATSLWFGLGAPERWASDSLRRQVWCAADDLLAAHPPRTFSLDEFEWGGLRFQLRRWVGASVPGAGSSAAAAAPPAFEGGMADLRRLPEPEAGLYVLDLEVPLAEPADVVRGRAWLLFLPWETASYPFTDMDPERHPEVWAEMIRREPPSNRRAANALALCTLLTPDVPPGYRETFFGVVAEAELRLPPGAYRLVTSSDDGVRVWLDDRLLIDRWVGRALTTDVADFTSDGGARRLRVEFFQGMGHYKLWLRVEASEPAAMHVRR